MPTITLTLRDLAHSGEATGLHEGRTIFVPLGLPGERVRVELVEEFKRHARARLLEVLEPAPERVEAPCPHFGVCGGCSWQHIAYEAQLRFKQEMVRAQLQRLGQQVKPLVREVWGMEQPWAYRNQVQLVADEEGRLGYQALRSHDAVPVEVCLVTHPLLDDLWSALDLEVEELDRLILRAGTATGEQMLILEGPAEAIPELEVDMPISCLYQGDDGRLTVLVGDSFFHEQVGGRRFRVSGPSFFQVNTAQAERLVEVAQRYLAPQPKEALLDAYCGVGLFSLLFAPQVGSVLGIEESPWAIADAQANAAGMEQVTFVEGTVEEVLPALGRAFDVVLLDPPRAGCAPAALRALAACQPSRIVYVSCDPATLARDVATLATLGYALVEVQPVDMFPHTAHVECVALLRRLSA